MDWIKRRSGLVLVVVALLAVSLFAFSGLRKEKTGVGRRLAPNEPVYNGKPLSEWVEIGYSVSHFAPPSPQTNWTTPIWARLGVGPQDDSSSGVEEDPKIAKQRKEVWDAIRQIGTNALPFLLATLSPDESSLKLQLLDVSSGKPLTNQAISLAMHVAFTALGSRAKPALPELSQLIKRDDVAFEAKNAALMAMMGCGPDGVDPLLQALGNKNPNIRMWAVIRLSANLGSHPSALPEDAGIFEQRIAPQVAKLAKDPDQHVRFRVASFFSRHSRAAEIAVPALVGLPNDSSDNVTVEAARALAGFGPEAKSAVPKLTDLLQDESKRVRLAVREALEKIQAPTINTNK